MVLISDHLNLSSQVQRSPLTLGSGVKPQQPARMYHGMFLCNASHHRRHCQEHDRKEMNLLHYVHHKYTGKYPWLRVGNCKELFSLGDTCQQAWFNSSTGFALDRLRHILNISQMPSISIEEAGFPTLLVCGTPQPEEQEQPRERRQSETDASRTLQRQQAGNFATNTWKA